MDAPTDTAPPPAAPAVEEHFGVTCVRLPGGVDLLVTHGEHGGWYMRRLAGRHDVRRMPEA